MNNTETSLVKVSLFNVINNRHCPQCGSQMKESEKRKEGAFTFVWFECIKSGCKGQWIQSYAESLPKLFNQKVSQEKIYNL
jgi:hypothetical protein